MPLIEKPEKKGKSQTVEIRIAYLFVFLAVVSALIGILYHQADTLYQTAVQQGQSAQTELETALQDNQALETKISELLKKLTRLNELYSASLKKTALRVEDIETVQRSTAQKFYELKSMNEYLLEQNQQLGQKLQSCQKARLSSSSFDTDPDNPNIQRERIT